MNEYIRLLRSTGFLMALVFVLFACSEDVPKPGDNDSDPEPFEIPATEDIVMYEVNLRAFSPGGDLQGVIDRLDNLQDLGINVIWLMPIHPIGQINSVNSPYSVRDYKAVGHEYGTMEDLKELTEQAHARGMAVIMDWVANHTSWDNPWILNEDWYTQDGEGNIVHPPGTNWYDVADLNFDNMEMRAAMIEAMTWWVKEANVDGYRCDYADGVPHDFWVQAIDSLNATGRDLILLAEGTRIDHYHAGFDLIFAWDFYYRMIDVYNGQAVSILYTTHHAEYNGVPDGRHRLRYTTNHDESAWEHTPMVFFDGKEGALAASVVTIYMGGVPLLYTGQEVGRVHNVPFFSNDPVNWNKNPDMLQAYHDMMEAYNRLDVARKGILANFSGTDVICFRKSLDGNQLLVVANMRGHSTTFSLHGSLQHTSWENALTGEIVELGAYVPLDAYQYMILEN